MPALFFSWIMQHFIKHKSSQTAFMNMTSLQSSYLNSLELHWYVWNRRFTARTCYRICSSNMTQPHRHGPESLRKFCGTVLSPCHKGGIQAVQRRMEVWSIIRMAFLMKWQVIRQMNSTAEYQLQSRRFIVFIKFHSQLTMQLSI